MRRCYERGARVEVRWQGEWLPSRIVRCWSDGADVVVGTLGCWYVMWELIRDPR